MKLNDLRPDRGSRKERKRVGRGTGSGRGKTAGRGTKGQNARSGGGVAPYFEGGQLPLARRLPYKRGFHNRNKIIYQPVNVRDLAAFEEGTEVDPVVLTIVGVLKAPTEPIVVLGDGEIEVALTVRAHRFSKSAREKIERAGGKVEILPLD
ncbi:MAG: 50S ribosomal protein L15 [Candidatus Promineifilaceae bacterium]|nr:50S ribosomal protein L15 [Candidatus Promineifilaceae bacterium]